MRTVVPTSRCTRPVAVVRHRAAPVAPRSSVVASGFFSKFRPNSKDAGIYGSQGRDDFDKDDIEHYFNYMGMLATEGSYDRMETMMSTGLQPIDIILLMACSENDTPKVQELLEAGADVNVADENGKTPLQLCTKEEIKKMLIAKGAK